MSRPTRVWRVEYVAEGDKGADHAHRNFWGDLDGVVDFIRTLPAKRQEQTTVLGVWRGDVRWTAVTPKELEAVAL